MRHWAYIVAAIFSSGACFCRAADAPNGPDKIFGRFADLAARAEAQQHAAIAGQDGWLFLTAELRHLGVARFWGPEARTVSRAGSADVADPLPAILDFKAQLESAGIELLLAPVPAKAAIYSDKAGVPAASARADVADAAFFRLCAEQGVEALLTIPCHAQAAWHAPLFQDFL